MPFPGNEVRIAAEDGSQCPPGEAHPYVGAVAVIGVPDDKWGEAVSAVVVPAPGAVVVPFDLQEHVRSRLARFKAPRHVFVADELPVLATGKIGKKQLRARYAGEAEG
jgi:acyl-CoA synthetase (AMP-forming)/AMP-acid ligase II